MSLLTKPRTLPGAALWDQRVDQMGLSLAESPLGPLIEQLYAELAASGIDFRPPLYIASEWGCPDGVPIIGLPFYLVDPRLHAYEEEHCDDLEDATRIMAGLRHEAGHAIGYAYHLWQDPEWTALFGDFHAEYGDDYRPRPFSRRYVRHLPGWYAQKHADEDFAETFAVWLTPGLDWRREYAGWPCLAKLEYVDRIMKAIGKSPTRVDMSTVGPPDADEIAFTVGELYEMRAEEDTPPVAELGTRLDGDLRQMFSAEGPGTDAAQLLTAHGRTIMNAVSAHAGSRMYVVKAVLDRLTERLHELGLRAAPGQEVAAMIRLTSLVQTVVQLYLERGELLPPDLDPAAVTE
jgi:hypothetical protein